MGCLGGSVKHLTLDFSSGHDLRAGRGVCLKCNPCHLSLPLLRKKKKEKKGSIQFPLLGA